MKLRTLLLVVAGLVAIDLLVASASAETAAPATRVYWEEHFRDPLNWVAPFDESPKDVARVYSVAASDGFSFLHAHHDGAAPSPPKATHYGRAFARPIPLDKVQALTWRWRVTHHPAVTKDPWEDLGASLYVLVQRPSFFKNGKGYKFGWLARAMPGGDQKGLREVALRSEPAGPEWKTEKVDLCALFRRDFGACEGEHLLYVGVLTDGDGTKSLAEGDYADFTVVAN